MADTSQALEQRNPSRELVEWVRSDETRQQIARALPEGVSVDRFERATTTALLAKPELVSADRASLYLALLSAAQAGLVPDGKQAAIVVYKTKVKDAQGNEHWIEKAQFLAMIGGVRDTLAEYGWALRTEVVCENDRFEDHSSEGYVVHNKPRPGVDRGAIEGAYAMAVHRDGRREAVVMSKTDIDKVRDKAARSKAIWNDWYDRMCEKTVGHRLAKKLPLDPKDRARLDRALVEDIDPAEAAELLYGPDGSRFNATPAPPAEGPRSGDGDRQQAASGGTDGSPQPPAAAAPGDDDEPEPGPSPADDERVTAAAGTEIPSGNYKGMTLGQIGELGEDGEKWLDYALRHRSKYDDEFVAALETFVQGRIPEVWERHSEQAAA